MSSVDNKGAGPYIGFALAKKIWYKEEFQVKQSFPLTYFT